MWTFALFSGPYTIAAILLALISQASARNVGFDLPGAFIFEFEDHLKLRELYFELEEGSNIRTEYDHHLFRGVSIEFKDVERSHEKASKLAARSGIKNMWPVKLYELPISSNEKVGAVPKNTFSTSQALANRHRQIPGPHLMTQIDRLHQEGITGEGVKIAIIDSGVDYQHPALGGCFGRRCLVSFGTDLVGDDYNGQNTPRPDKDPMDCIGHGTHVAGIIGAQPNSIGIVGAAPNATIGAYKVFGCQGSVGSDILISAFLMAYQDGANIITASLGEPSGWSQDPWALVVSRIVKLGIPCTMSAGNRGGEGAFFASGAADGDGVISVASYDNIQTSTLLYAATYSIDNGDDIQFAYAKAQPHTWENLTLELFALNFDVTVADDACHPLGDNVPDLSHKIVLLRRGSCPFYQKAINVAAKGAEYIVVYNNDTGTTEFDLSVAKGVLAGGMVAPEIGERWIEAMKEGKTVKLTIAPPSEGNSMVLIDHNSISGGALSLSSSWGPTWKMGMKPQLGAPGSSILSTFPQAHTGYAVLSGTSAACPLVAGILALVSQVRGTFNPKMLESLISSTARPQLFHDGQRFASFFAPVPQQGSGLIQAYDAAFSQISTEPASISFPESTKPVGSRRLTIMNSGNKGVTLNISYVPAATVIVLQEGAAYPSRFPNELSQTTAVLNFSTHSVHILAGSNTTIEICPHVPDDIEKMRLSVWSGWMIINGSSGTSASVPYQGLSGSLSHSRVLTPTDTWMAHSKASTEQPAAINTTFSVSPPGISDPKDDLPTLVWQLALGSSYVQVDVVLLTGDLECEMLSDPWGGTVIGHPYGFPKRWNARGKYIHSWNGQLNNGSFAPSGLYRFITRALRIGGNPANRSDWDRSNSIYFRLEYRTPPQTGFLTFWRRPFHFF